jgi:hypothetical protein
MKMAEDLARKRNVRRAHRAAVTKLVGQVTELCQRSESDTAQLRQKKQSLGEKRDFIKKMDDEILLLTPDEHLEEEIQRADEVIEQIDLSLLTIEEKLKVSRSPSPTIVIPHLRVVAVHIKLLIHPLGTQGLL